MMSCKLVNCWLFLLLLSVCCGQDIQYLRKTINLARSNELRKVHTVFHEIEVDKLVENKLLHIDVNTSLSLSQECREDLDPLVAYFKKKNESGVPEDFVNGPMLQMVDAIGKIPPGVFEGAVIFWGSYPECKKISYKFPNRQRLWKTEYSRAYFNPSLKDGKDPENCKDHLGAWDFCLPKGCNKTDVLVLLQNIITLPSTNSSPFCKVDLIDDVPRNVNYQTVVVCFIIGTILVTGILASVVDYYFVLKPGSLARKETLLKIFLSFSLYNNIREIFTVKSAKKSGQIGVLHCIRFFSICWIIQSHAFVATATHSNNILEVYDSVKDLTTQFIANPFFAVDSFFFLSGLLLAFLWFKEYKKDKKKVMSLRGWGLFYLHRVIRLSPPYYLAFLFFVFVYPTLFHNMPLWIPPDYIYHTNDDPCTKIFWVNLLYLNNYVHWKTHCYQVSWYLATDMQMFIFTPLLLVPLALNKILGLVTAGAILMVSTAVNIFMVYKHHYPPTNYVTGWKDPLETETSAEEYQLWMYTSPYIRCQVYIIGILVGYLLQMKPKLRINKILNLGLWVLSFSLMLFMVLCLYRYYNNHELSLFGRAMYSAFSKPIWAIGLSWIVISCYYGYGGPINQLFMSWNIWVPLSRLSYCVYLIHYMVVWYIMGLTQAPIIFSGFVDMWLKLVLPIIFCSFFIAIIWSAAFEMPFSKAEMILLKAKSSSRPTNEVEEAKFQYAWTSKL